MNLVAVYGTLRKGMSNNDLLNKSTYKGKYETKPVYSLYDLGRFPGLKIQGNTSVVMEVYEVDDQTLKSIDVLEGYDVEDGENNQFYNRMTVATPWGLAYSYFYIPKNVENKIEDGDWVKYYKTNTVLKNLIDNVKKV